MTSPGAAPSRYPAGPRRGAALILTLLISVAIAGMAIGAVMLASGAQGSTHFTAREAALQSAADAGLEIIRDSLNRGVYDSLVPDSGFTTIADALPVYDALGSAIPNVTRSLYVGRTGGRTGGAATAGQYGSNFASAVSIISDQRGAVAARRLLLTQDSWAKYAVAINNWSGTGYYACDESINGPVHSNTTIHLQAGCSGPRAQFAGPVTVVNSILNQSSGDFLAGAQLGATPIPWPTPARISLMRQYAQDADAANGDYDLTSLTSGAKSPGLRIEFLVIDVNGDGVIDWNEGYMRVWVPANTSDSVLAYATGRRWPTVPAGVNATDDPNTLSRTCGAVTRIDGAGPSQFFTASAIYSQTSGTASDKLDSVRAALRSGTRHCYLGGDPHLFASTGGVFTPDPLLTMTPGGNADLGQWKTRRTGAFAPVSAARPTDASYLIPLGGNVAFKGVIYVQGDVAISGRLRGRVTVFATGNVIMADDVLYQNSPGSKCDTQGDILGLVTLGDAIIEDNTLQTPFNVAGVVFGGFDDTNDANYDAFIMAAGTGGSGGNWYGEGLVAPFVTSTVGWTGDASAVAQHCGQAPNGCVRVSGGLAEGRFDGGTFSAHIYGWGEAHTYDQCGAVNPPPYYPTTGRFSASRYYELDPVWLRHLTIAQYFANLQGQ